MEGPEGPEELRGYGGYERVQKRVRGSGPYPCTLPGPSEGTGPYPLYKGVWPNMGFLEVERAITPIVAKRVALLYPIVSLYNVGSRHTWYWCTYHG